MGRLFGTDGIRGVANVEPMTAERALQIGRAVAYLFKREGHKARIIIGKDTRISGYMLENALVAGICSMGANAYVVGPLPTPGIAFITQSMRADAGIVISASHNAYQDNGIKIFSGDGFKLPDRMEEKLEGLILDGKLEGLVPEAGAIGKAKRIDDAEGRYIVFLKHSFPDDLSMEAMKIVMDCANGATYKVAPNSFIELGADVKAIYTEPNGFNINKECGSQFPEEMARKVVETKSAIGLAFDGDGDRLIAVDETGAVVSGDQILAICAFQLKEAGRLRNDLVVSTVMANYGLGLAFEERGIHKIETKVGDRYVLESMRAQDSVIGGENSGHLIFLEHHTTGDGILSALQLIAAMIREGKPLSELAKVMKVYPQTLINVGVSSKPLIEEIPGVADIIKQVEDELTGNGRVLVRYSGTELKCRVMVEGRTQELTDRYSGMIADVVRGRIGSGS